MVSTGEPLSGDRDSQMLRAPGQVDLPLWPPPPKSSLNGASRAQHTESLRSYWQELGGAGGRAPAECMSVFTLLYSCVENL